MDQEKFERATGNYRKAQKQVQDQERRVGAIEDAIAKKEKERKAAEKRLGELQTAANAALGELVMAKGISVTDLEGEAPSSAGFSCAETENETL